MWTNCTDNELCTYLQALEAGYLPTSSSATSASAQSKSMAIASKSYRKGRKTVAFPGFQFGMMPAVSTATPGEDSSTACAQASPASPSAPPASSSENTTKETCGQRSRGYLAKYDPAGHCWRTSQLSLLTSTLEEYSQTWPRSGLMLGGVVWGRLDMEPISLAKGYGSTPRVPTQVRKPALSLRFFWGQC